MIPATLRLAVLLLLGTPWLHGTARAQDWQQELTAYMATRYDCQVDDFSRVRERQQGERQLLSTRVHCRDRRQFDVSRFGQMEPFEVRRCEDRPIDAC